MSQETEAKESPCLESLTLNPGEISFAPDVYDYQVQVAEGTEKLLVKAKAAAGCSFTVNGNSGLRSGQNEIRITVTGAQYDQAVYRIHVQVGEARAEAQTAGLTEGSGSGETEAQTAVPSDFLTHLATGSNRYVTIGLGVCAGLAVVLWITFFIRRILIRREYRRRKEEKSRRREEVRHRVELAGQQEEELLRQIERLAQKSRTVKTIDANGLRIIELDDEEDQEEAVSDDWEEDDNWEEMDDWEDGQKEEYGYEDGPNDEDPDEYDDDEGGGSDDD